MHYWRNGAPEPLTMQWRSLIFDSSLKYIKHTESSISSSLRLPRTAIEKAHKSSALMVGLEIERLPLGSAEFGIDELYKLYTRASVYCCTETLSMFEMPRLHLLLYSKNRRAEFFQKYCSGFLKSAWTAGWSKPMSFQISVTEQCHMLPRALFSHMCRLLKCFFIKQTAWEC